MQTDVNVCRKPEDLSGAGKTCCWTYTRRIFTVSYTVQRVSLIPISSYMLPMRPHFGVSHYSPKYAVCSSVSLFLKLTDEKSVPSLTFSLDWPRVHQLLRSVPLNLVSICSTGTKPSTSSCPNSSSVPVVV